MQQVKREIVKEFNKLINDLNFGRDYHYCKILELINFTQLYDYLPNPEFIKRCLLA